MVQKINGISVPTNDSCASDSDAAAHPKSYFERRMIELGYEPENDSSWYESHPDSKKTNNPPLFFQILFEFLF
jgi:hypothetical protein